MDKMIEVIKNIPEGYDSIVEAGKQKIACVMCGSLAFVVAHETNEPLCRTCEAGNDETRRR